MTNDDALQLRRPVVADQVSRPRPKVVCVEFNSIFPLGESRVIPYDPNFKHDGTNYFGASLGAMIKLGRQKGYALVHQHHSVNAFFVRRDLLPSDAVIQVPFEVKQYHRPDQGGRPWVEY